MNITKYMNRFSALIVTTLTVATLLGGCTGSTTNTSSSTAAQGEVPVAPEKNPSGDIPDTQVFVQYRSTVGGYQLDIPEGWSRSEQGTDVNFVDKLDGVKVTITPADTAPTTDSVRNNEVATLLKSGRAVQVGKVQNAKLPEGSVVQIEYTSNSEPDSVTGKQVRLENQMFLFFQNGHLATLTLWAPLGADNIDQWQRMSQSFRWY
jgi:hypothetical protein